MRNTILGLTVVIDINTMEWRNDNLLYIRSVLITLLFLCIKLISIKTSFANFNLNLLSKLIKFLVFKCCVKNKTFLLIKHFFYHILI